MSKAKSTGTPPAQPVGRLSHRSREAEADLHDLIRVQGARGVAVPFEDYTGVFHVDLILSDGLDPRRNG